MLTGGLRHVTGISAHRPLMRGLMPARRAVAALEFGILAPVMAILLIGVFNLAKIAVLWEQVWSASRSIAESATTLAIQPDGSAALNVQQVNQALSEVYAEIPWVAAGIATGSYSGPGNLPPNTVTAVLSSVDFVPQLSPQDGSCAAKCTYVSSVLWSKAYVPPNGLTGFNFATSALRPCGKPLAQDNVTVGVAAKYKASNINVPDPFLVADVTLVYTPFLFNFITGNVSLHATSYVPVRTNIPGTTTSEAATFDDSGDTTPAAECPGSKPSG